MGHVRDRWTVKGPPDKRGRPTRIKGPRWGKGLRYQARWIEAGREVNRGFPNSAAAELFVAGKVVDKATGRRTRPVTEMTFGEYAEAWRLLQMHHRPASERQVGSILKCRLLPELGDIQLADMARRDVQAAVAAWRKRYAPATVHVTYSYVTAILTAAVIDELIEESPCVRISLPEMVRQKVVPLTPEQVHTIWEKVPAWYRSMVIVAAGTGMRGGELRGLTWDRVTPFGLRVDRQLIGVKVIGVKDRRPVWGPPKSAAGDRTVQVGPSIRSALTKHLETYGDGVDGLVWTTKRKGPLTRDDLSQVWRDVTEGMALRDRSGWHDLRHFHASLLIAEGLSAAAVADRLGDRPTEIMKTYAHLWHDDHQRAVQAAEKMLAVGPSGTVAASPEGSG